MKLEKDGSGKSLGLIGACVYHTLRLLFSERVAEGFYRWSTLWLALIGAFYLFCAGLCVSAMPRNRDSKATLLILWWLVAMFVVVAVMSLIEHRRAWRNK